MLQNSDLYYSENQGNRANSIGDANIAVNY